MKKNVYRHKKEDEASQIPQNDQQQNVAQNLPPQVTQPFNPMSPIMETSREHYKSSTTSSSNASFSKSNLTKSHWGNTQLATQNATPGTSLGCNNKTRNLSGKQEIKPTELTSNSGYMADSSSARTPGNICLKFIQCVLREYGLRQKYVFFIYNFYPIERTSL